MYELRTHSLRKFFKTNMEHAGVKTDYVEYMMGHTVDTYNDIQSLGIENLRNIYAAASLEIRPKTTASKMKAVKEMIRAYGVDPDQILTREALAEAAITYKTPEERQAYNLQVWTRELRELINQDIQADIQQYKRT